ncbi:MAG: hypothetical protein RL160_1549 [Bacteroidota bacterium]
MSASMKRRKFLQNTAAAGTILPITLGSHKLQAFGPNSMLGALAKAAAQTDRVLVIIQLNGGNDGLNTLIPLDQYSNLSKVRQNVLIGDTKVLKLNGKTGTGLHPAMTGMQSMYNEGLISAVQNVGYPNPNFSHFRSTDIWMSASDSNVLEPSGWMGRYLDQVFPGFPTGYPNAAMTDPLAIQIGAGVSLTFMGPDMNMAMAITDPSSFYNLVTGNTDSAPATPAGKELTYIRTIAQQTQEYGTVIKAAANTGKNLATYPSNNPLADQLKIVAKLIHGGLKTPVYMVSQGGYDTHSAQVDTADTTKGAHATLLQRLSDAIKVFQDDLKLLGIQDRVAGMTFSEFGRRVMSNFSNGTDHGAAAPLFVFGSSVNPGIIGNNPVIPSTVSVNDNVPMSYDFRQVYATVLKDWFGLNDSEVKSAMLGGTFQTLPIFKAGSTKLEDFADLLSRISLDDPYPNPASGSAQVRFYTDGGQVELRLFDTMGSLIRIVSQGKHRSGSHELRLDLNGLRPGNYFLQLAQGNQRVTKTLVVR